MNIFLYIMIFIMGTLFGSFYTLAVYRIPRKIDIVKTHSFCTNCNHRLGFWELIPVLSYIALGGKCKECKQKIRPRYLILEVLSGLTFVLIAFGLNIKVETLNTHILVQALFLVLYLVAIFLIAGIDKEYRKIEKNVIYYILGVLGLYIIYLCVLDNISIYRYMVYLAILLGLLIIDTLRLRNKAKDSYVLSILILLIVMAVFTGEWATILTIISTLLMIAFTILEYKIKNKLNKTKKENKIISQTLTIGFYLCISNVVVLIINLFRIRFSM